MDFLGRRNGAKAVRARGAFRRRLLDRLSVRRLALRDVWDGQDGEALGFALRVLRDDLHRTRRRRAECGLLAEWLRGRVGRRGQHRPRVGLAETALRRRHPRTQQRGQQGGVRGVWLSILFSRFILFVS